MTDSADIEAVAKGLTKAQRDRIINSRQHRRPDQRIVTCGEDAEALYRANLVSTGGLMFWLTPLGEQVRAYLQSAERER